MKAIKIASKGESGNIFYILALVKQSLLKEYKYIEFDECYERVIRSHSYEEAFKIIREYIKVIDKDKQY